MIVTLPAQIYDDSYYIFVLDNDEDDVTTAQDSIIFVNTITTQGTEGECAISMDFTQVVYTPYEGTNFAGSDECEYEACISKDEDEEGDVVCDVALVKLTIERDDEFITGVPTDTDAGEADNTIPMDQVIFPMTQLVSLDDSDYVNMDAVTAIYGNTAIVGAWNNDLESENHHGVVLIFVKDETSGEWIKQAKLLPPDGGNYTFFGSSLRIYEDTLIVGAYGDGDYIGSAHIFVRKEDSDKEGTFNWYHQAKLVAPDGEANDFFGMMVSIYKSTAVVSAPGDGDNAGSAHVFIREEDGTSWTHKAKLVAPDGAANDYFGNCVAIHEDIVVVCAWQDDNEQTNSTDSGSAHIFVRGDDDDNWSHKAQLMDSEGESKDYFANRLAIFGDTIVVGAKGDDSDDGYGEDHGSVYVFVRNGDDGSKWDRQAKLLSPDGAVGDGFGNNIDLYEDTVVVGSRWDDDSGTDSGSAHVFVREGDTWTHRAKLLAYEGGESENDFFGYTVGIHDQTIVVSSMSGEAHVFSDYL